MLQSLRHYGKNTFPWHMSVSLYIHTCSQPFLHELLLYIWLCKVESQNKYTKWILSSRKEEYYSKWMNLAAMWISKCKVSTFHGKKSQVKSSKMRVQALIFPLLYVWLSANYLTFLSLSFIIYKYRWNSPFSHWVVWRSKEIIVVIIAVIVVKRAT